MTMIQGYRQRARLGSNLAFCLLGLKNVMLVVFHQHCWLRDEKTPTPVIMTSCLFLFSYILKMKMDLQLYSSVEYNVQSLISKVEVGRIWKWWGLFFHCYFFFLKTDRVRPVWPVNSALNLSDKTIINCCSVWVHVIHYPFNNKENSARWEKLWDWSNKQ